jgi:hypothetical protein
MEVIMMIRTATSLALLILPSLVAPSIAAADDPLEIRGETVAIRQAVATQDAGDLDRLTLRTRAGETRHLLLGEAGSVPEEVRVGDRVRVRVMAGEPAGEPQRVRTMRLRGGESYTFRNEAGELVRMRAQRQVEAGADPPSPRRTRQRDRGQDPACRGGDRGGRAGRGGARRR